MATANSVKDNLEKIQERIGEAARRAGRKPEEITLIGVSKTHPAEAIREAFEAGIRHFGENRVQEWEGKRGGVEDLEGKWHLIGHLQSNKAARAAKVFHSVDSLDDLDLARRLNRAREEQGESQKLRVLIEVHIAEEETKSGVGIPQLTELAKYVGGLAQLQLAGLMCIPPYLEDIQFVRPYFRKLRELRDTLEKDLHLKLPVLSMGMSHDFEVAIEEGATEVRVGTAIFGKRETK